MKFKGCYLMQIYKLKQKSIYLAPFNDESQALHKFLAQTKDYNFLGYIDSFKTADNIDNIDNIQDVYDYIIILSPYHHKVIVKNILSLGIKKNNLIYCNRANKQSSCFHFYTSQTIYDFYNFIFNKYNQLSLLSFNDYIELLKLKNKHKNKRAFIIANGPSLKPRDLDLLKNEITLASNKIYLAFEQTNWRPSYYFVTDGLVYTQNYKKIDQLRLNKFFSSHMISLKKKMKDSTYFSLSYQQPAQFKTNPIFGIYSGSTVTYVMLEFAIYMGIKEIYLIGLDFNFELPNNVSSKELICEGEMNHFHKGYRKIGEKWTKPNLQLQRDAFLKAKDYCKKNNIKIYNVSKNTKLDVFESIDFEKII